MEQWWQALEMRHPQGKSLRVERPFFLAPMEGITDPTFRDLVISCGGVGVVCTDFMRVAGAPIRRGAIGRRLGRLRNDCLVGVQLMAGETDYLEETVREATVAGAHFIDLNFGCPAPKVFNNCAGSALLDYPERLEEIICTVVQATDVPVSAKVRAGVADDSLLKEICCAAGAAGAGLLSMHARRRVDPYSQPARWQWIAESVEIMQACYPDVPVIGNGSVATAADARRMMKETGCAGVMVGIGAVANPWIFREFIGQPAADKPEALDFALRYAAAMIRERGEKKSLGRFKQFLRNCSLAGLLTAERQQQFLRSRSFEEILHWLQAQQLRNSEATAT